MERAAKMGSAGAQRNLACTYAVGETVPYNPEKAIYWYTKAAEQGYAEAQNDTAGMWLDGEAGKVDLEKAILWYEKCASNAHYVPYAQWAAETLSQIYGGKFDASYLDKEKEAYWNKRAEYLSALELRPHPDWFYE